MPAWGWPLTETFVWLSFSANRRCSSRFGCKPAHHPPAPPTPRPSSPPLSATAVAAVLNVRTRRHTHPEKNKTKQKKKTIQDACPTSDAPAAGATFRYQTRPQVKNKMQNSASNSIFFCCHKFRLFTPLHRAPDGNIWPESEKAVGALPCDLRRTKLNRNGGRRRGGPRMQEFDDNDIKSMTSSLFYHFPPSPLHVGFHLLFLVCLLFIYLGETA